MLASCLYVNCSHAQLAAWRVRQVFYVILAIGCLCSLAAAASAGASQRPNILLIVADDLGYSDVGFMGSEIRTPNLDALARSGVIFTDFYAAPTCSPSRAMLLTGTDSHLAGLGTMAERLQPWHDGVPGYEGYLNWRVVTVARLLKDAGYRTYMAGKWHLGIQDEQGPHKRGFEQSFALLEGGASHFSDASGLSQRHPRASYRENGRPTELPDTFFSTRFYTDKIISYIDADREQSKPFFAYIAYTAPHWPLQVPDAYLEHYSGSYDDGYDELKSRRLIRGKQLGLLQEAAEASARLPEVPAWSSLSTEAQRNSARSMELYAAMVDNLDVNIGRLIDYLKRTGRDENTVIIFLSDNGPRGGDLYRVMRNRPWVERNFDLRYENKGRINSYTFAETGWAQASATPFRMYKGSTAEGGIRVPAFIHYPALGEAARVERGVATVTDIAPTLVDLAQAKPQQEEYARKNMLPMTGTSLWPVITGKLKTAARPESYVGWELSGNRGLRKDNWKLLRLQAPYGPGTWQLYDLARDPAERIDQAGDRPQILSKLIALWRRYAENNNVVEF